MMRGPQWKIVAAGCNGALAVGFAALGAHALPEDLPERLRSAYATGADLHLAHAAVLAALALQPRFGAAFALILAGVLAFSGSLYALALTGVKTIGFVTPLGGLLLLAGWATFAAAGFRGPKDR